MGAKEFVATSMQRPTKECASEASTLLVYIIISVTLGSYTLCMRNFDSGVGMCVLSCSSIVVSGSMGPVIRRHQPRMTRVCTVIPEVSQKTKKIAIKEENVCSWYPGLISGDIEVTRHNL